MLPLMHDRLDPLFETALLLYLCEQGDPEFLREESIKELIELGLDGEAFYSRHARAYDKYVRVFAGCRRVEPEETELLQGGTEVFFMRILPFLEDPSQLKQKGGNARQLAQAVVRAGSICFEKEWQLPTPGQEPNAPWPGEQSLEGLLALVRKMELSEADRWRALELLCDPVPQFTRMAALLERNLAAQKKAEQAVAAPLQALLAKRDPDPQHLGGAYFTKKPEQVKEIWPSLAIPFGLLLADEICYCGLLCEPLMAVSQGRCEADQMLAVRLKALGDKTRLEILDELRRRGGSYNAALAQELGLTPATISHHLDILITAGLLEMRQEEKRLYCNVKERAVEEVAEALLRRFGGAKK